MTKSSAEPVGQVFRLTDMDVEEVSMVDRAANRRKFLVVKRDGDQMGALKPDGKGGFISTGTAAKADDEEDKDKTKKASLEVPPGFKEAVTPLLDKAALALESLSEAVGSSTAAEMTDDGEMPGVPAEFASGITSVMTMLDRAQSMWPTQAPEPTEGEPTEEGAPTEVETALSMRLALDNLGKAFMHKRLNKALVQKIGAKMSKDRLTRLQQAVTQLANLVNEVAGQPAQSPTGAPPIGKAGTQKAVEHTTLDKLTADINALTTQVGKLAQIVTSDRQKLTTLAKSREAPSRGPIDDSHPHRESEEVSWPLDMTTPINRETVGKGESFFDD